MRLASLFLMIATALSAQIAIGPNSAAGLPGLIKKLDWYNQISTGPPQGDTYLFTAWAASAAGMPVTGGLPIIGTFNDGHFGACSGNLGLLQLDTFSWSTPTASHMSAVNCMTSYSAGETNTGNGWYWMLRNADGGASIGDGSWKSRAPFFKNGLLYFPVERQIHAGGPGIHDATYIVSPDKGLHWCNPYSLYHGTTPGTCDSSNWQADGDAPVCGASAIGGSCTNAAYLDSTHSSMLWKSLPYGSENWIWVNYGNQDGQPFPAGAGVKDGCDPNQYTCFMLTTGDGSVARVPNSGNILNAADWRYYTCATVVGCDPTNNANWTATYANRTQTTYLSYSGGPAQGSPQFIAGYSITYLKEFDSYLMGANSTDMSWAPSIFGPWTKFAERYNDIPGNFLTPIPAIGYNVISTSPPHIELTFFANNYLGGEGSPYVTQWDLVDGKRDTGDAFQVSPTFPRTGCCFGSPIGAGYQFSTGNVAGSFPRKGLVWSFDLLDFGVAAGAGQFPYWKDRGGTRAVIASCTDGSFSGPTLCGSVNSGRGTQIDGGPWLSMHDAGYPAQWRVFPSEAPLFGVSAVPTWMLGNSSYSVIQVVRYEGGNSPRPLWSAGAGSAVSLDHFNGLLALDFSNQGGNHWRYVSNFTFPNTSNWYFIATTVAANGSGCPNTSIWVGGAAVAGTLKDTVAGVSCTVSPSAGPSATPSIGSGPFVIGMGESSQSATLSFATLMTYSRALSSPEVQMAYRSMKAKMALRGITVQ